MRYDVVEVDASPANHTADLKTVITAVASEGGRVISHTYVPRTLEAGAIISVIVEYDA